MTQADFILLLMQMLMDEKEQNNKLKVELKTKEKMQNDSYIMITKKESIPVLSFFVIQLSCIQFFFF